MRGRQLLKTSINLVDLIDLENLKRWRDQNLYIKMNDCDRVPLHYRPLTLDDISDTYGFDKYGLIVQGEFVSMRAVIVCSEDKDANICLLLKGDVITLIRKRQRPVESN